MSNGSSKKYRLKIKKRTLLIVDWANVWGWSKNLKWQVCPKKLYNFFDRPKIIDKRLYCGIEVGQKKSEDFKVDMENLGFSVVSKEVKWPPVLLEKQNHFKKIVMQLNTVLENVGNKHSDISNKLYDLTTKIKKLQNIEVEEKDIFELIAEIDGDLKNLDIDIGDLQNGLKKPTNRRKCDFDVEITRDALNMANDYDTLLLFSGDGDYFAVVEDLIKKGKKVILIFAEGHLGKEFLNYSFNPSLFCLCSVNNIKNAIKK